MVEHPPIIIKKQWFVSSREGNIKEEYSFEKKLGEGGYGAVYQATHIKKGTNFYTFLSNYISKVIPYNKHRNQSCNQGYPKAKGEGLPDFPDRDKHFEGSRPSKYFEDI